MAAGTPPADFDEFTDWLVAQEQAGASLDEICAQVVDDYDRHLAGIHDAFAAWEAAERQADEDPVDDRLEEARRATMDEAIAIADRPPQRRSTRGDWLAWKAIRKPARSMVPRRRDRRLACPRPRARAAVRSSSRGGDSGDPDEPDEHVDRRRKKSSHPRPDQGGGP
jgi:hypothetical protein